MNARSKAYSLKAKKPEISLQPLVLPVICYQLCHKNSLKTSLYKTAQHHKTASASQQNLIQTLCKEKAKDLDTALAPYNKELSTITSDEANQII